MSSFTPGPWDRSGVRLKMGNFDFHTVYAPGKPDISIAEVWYDAKRRHVEDLANAKLISAAPELLEAVKLAHTILWQASGLSFGEYEHTEAGAKIRAAISKAEM